MMKKNNQHTKIENLKGEIWKAVPGYEGYFVSSLGRVKRAAHETVCIDWYDYTTKHFPEHILNGSIDGEGYRHVKLKSIHGNKNGDLWKIHQLVAAAFLGYDRTAAKDRHDSSRIIVDHKNRNKD